MRQCAVTRTRRAPDDLIRFVADPEGRIVPDLKAALPGRGVWLTCACDVVEKAARSGVFARAFRAPVRAEPDLPERVDALLEREAVQRLSLANKAGLVTFGFAKVGEAVARGRAAALIHARDAAEDGCRKLDGKFAAAGNGAEARESVVNCLHSGQLGLALGRSSVVHAAVSLGGASEKFLTAAARLQRFRDGSAGFAAA